MVTFVAGNGLLACRRELVSEMLAYEPILAIASSIENVGAMKRTVTGLNLAKVLKLLAGEFGALRHNNYITKRVTVNTQRYLIRWLRINTFVLVLLFSIFKRTFRHSGAAKH